MKDTITEKNIVKHLTAKQFVISLSITIFTAGAAVAGSFYKFLDRNQKNVETIVKKEIIPLRTSDSLMLELIKRNAVETMVEKTKSNQIVNYINDPALIKKINEQTEIIMQVKESLEDIKKNKNQNRGAS